MWRFVSRGEDEMIDMILKRPSWRLTTEKWSQVRIE